MVRVYSLLLMSSPFSALAAPAPDPIFAINAEAAKAGKDAINCSIGVMMDDDGQVLLYPSVQKAIAEVAKELPSMRFGYPPLLGVPGYRECVLPLIFGTHASRVASIATTAGTGSLAISLRLMKMLLKGNLDVILPMPAWANHPPPIRDAGMKIVEVPYIQEGKASIDGIVSVVQKMNAPFGLLLQTDCHNPTGLDLSESDWKALAEILKKKECVVLFDLAYQGFKAEPEKDVGPIPMFIEQGITTLVAWSAAKNHSIYSLRAGIACAVTSSEKEKADIESHYSMITRGIHSAASTFGEMIVLRVQENYGKEWRADLKSSRDILSRKRELLIKHLPENFHASLRGHGMFAMLPLSKEEVIKLKDEKVFLTLDGRINIGGIPERRIPEFCEKLGKIL